MTLGKRIRILRKKLNLSLEELARNAGVSQSALSRIECDLRRPTSATISSVAKALKTTVKELRGETFNPVDETSFDKQVGIIFARLDQITDTDKHLLKKHILDYSSPEDAARELREDLGITDDHIEPILAAGSLGLNVREDAFEGFEAALVRTDDKNFILLKSGLNLGRKNFLIAHELGHFRLTDHTESGYTCQLGTVETYQVNEAKELEANRFAIELLAPEQSIRYILKSKAPSIQLAKKVAEVFQVSYTVALSRLVDLASMPCALVTSHHATRKWFRRSSSFTNYLEIGIPVSKHSLAYKISNEDCSEQILENLEPLKGKVPARAWISDESVTKEQRIIEESVYIPSYDTILSLLMFK
jgi:transcriptional regulator with XRE-family HTH domain